MSNRPFARNLLPPLVACAFLFAHGCARREQQQPTPPSAQAEDAATAEEASPSTTITASEEAPPPAETRDAQTIEDEDAAAAQKMRDLPPPSPAEVGGATERVFGGAVVVESGRRPHFVVGDFNGDSSQDVAVVVRPAPGRLAEINDELANWILVAPVHPEAHARAVERRRVLAEESDVLLAVIHGHESAGWRDPQATQTYVLRNAAGERLKTRARRDIFGAAADRGRLPRLRGDVIAADLAGRPAGGFLYYNGAKYEWYDPRSFAPPAPARVVHGGAAAEELKR